MWSWLWSYHAFGEKRWWSRFYFRKIESWKPHICRYGIHGPIDCHSLTANSDSPTIRLRFHAYSWWTSWISFKGDKGKGFGLNINSKTADERLQKDLSRWSNISRHTAIRIYKHFFADFGKMSSNILPEFWNIKGLNFEIRQKAYERPFVTNIHKMSPTTPTF